MMIGVREVSCGRLDLNTRLPFRYGIAEMTGAPHAVVTVQVEINGELAIGVAAENLPPKWFTKDPSRDLADEINDMIVVINTAAEAAVGRSADTVFALWYELDRDLRAHAATQGHPALLAGLGTSLVERALVDAWCRGTGTQFPAAVGNNTLGIDLARLHPELSGASPGELLPSRPAAELKVRHTVGLSDPISAGDVTFRPDDDLPVALAEAITRYDISRLKIKVNGDPDHDIDRLARIREVLPDAATTRFTIDGNEMFRDPEAFLAWWQTVLDSPVGTFVQAHTLLIEQPMHRDVAMTAGMAEVLGRPDLPPVIIDESDATPTSAREAMDHGYRGVSYKGCKGVFRALANACLIRYRTDAGAVGLVMTTEDLSTIPPITVGQDLVITSTIGLGHLERNGHHYFGTTAPIGGPGTHDELVKAHPDCYRLSAAGARLAIVDGRVQIGSLLRAPFGCAPLFDTTKLPRLTPAGPNTNQ